MTHITKHTPGPLKAVQIIIENSPCTWAVQRKSIREQWGKPSIATYIDNEADARLYAAAPDMYEALTDAERMWNIARMIDSKHHAGNPISNDLWSDFHRYLMEWHAKRKAALAQAEGRQA